MEENTKTEINAKYLQKTKAALSSHDEDAVISELHKLKTSGKASVLPIILNLLAENRSDSITHEVVQLIAGLRDQQCVPIIVDHIEKGRFLENIHFVISACWQSQLNFSEHLAVFAKIFISGYYQSALESFTVIEEMLWRCDQNSIELCRSILLKDISKISEEKTPLFNELLKVLEEGKTTNEQEFPDFYKK